MPYEYLVHRNLSKKQVIDRYEPFTFPSFLRKSKVRDLQEPFFAVEALYEGERVGLAILELLHEKGLMKVLSLLVKDTYRRRGIASQILQIAEKIAQNHHLDHANIIFQNNWESFKIMPKLLRNLAWNEPQKRMITVRVSYRQVKDLSWFQIRGYPEGFSVRPWTSLNQEEYDFIRAKQNREQWFPPALSPFQLPNLLIDEGSLVLFHKGELVGWFISHLSAEKTMQVTSYFVDEKHRKTRASIAIVVEAIRCVYENGIAEQAIFMFEADNKNMINLSKKFVGQYNTGAFTEIWVGQKKLN